MLDMAYPSNKYTFGYLIEDTSMLLVKYPGRTRKMLSGHIENDSFVLEDRTSWGYRVLTDDLGKGSITSNFNSVTQKFR